MYDKRCSYCGKRLSEFCKTGMLGCPNCYEVFSDAVSEYIDKVQEGNYHSGKRPILNGVDKELLDEYKKLCKEKELAGLQGRFSDMAQLAQQIFSLREELIKRGLI